MSAFKITTLLVVIATAFGCGEQLVEFPLADAAPGGGSDTGVDPDGPPDDANPGSAPRVISTSPSDADTSVSINHRVTATFNRAMNPATLTDTSFKLQRNLLTITGTVSYTGVTATFIPNTALSLGTKYVATVTTIAADPQGNMLATDHVWNFTTGSCSQGPVILGAAGNFAVLAGSTVTNTGATAVTGDLGVSPGTAVTGFPPGTVTGSIEAGSGPAATAVADLTTAYTVTAARTVCPIDIAGDVGGQTFLPGLYKSTSALSIATADLTLDAQDDIDAVFVFQIASTFLTSANRRVILINGAQAKNVFWQVGSSATFGAGSDVKGTVMALTSITLNTAAVIEGRVLARNGAVTLDTNPIVIPAP
jgi:hypothetical protein